MKELIYTVLELEEWCSTKMPCSFCNILFKDEHKIVCQIRTRDKVTNRVISYDFACRSCKEKFENNELSKCEKCGRLKIKSNFDFFSNKYVCECEKESGEKELPSLPHQRGGMAVFYETQINNLREELTTAEEALEIEREEVVKFQEKSEEWGKRQKQELLDRIKELEEKIKQLEEENEKLKEQQNGQLTAQIEVKEPKRWSWLKVKK